MAASQSCDVAAAYANVAAAFTPASSANMHQCQIMAKWAVAWPELSKTVRWYQLFCPTGTWWNRK